MRTEVLAWLGPTVAGRRRLRFVLDFLHMRRPPIPGTPARHELDTAVREFLAESHENLDQLERDLVTVEDDVLDRATLDRIFRTIHSIKGACGFLACPKLEAVAHAGESLLCRLRDGELRWRPDITSAMLALADAMRELLASIEAIGAEGEAVHAELIRRLVALQEVSEDGEECERKPVGADDPPVAEGSSALHATLADSLDDAPVTDDHSVAQSQVEVRECAPPAPTAEPQEAPSSAISNGNVRVDVGLLDRLMNLVGELVLARNQILQHAGSRGDAALLGASQRLDLITTELQEGVMKTRMQPMGNIWKKLPRVVRDLSLTCGKQVRVEMEGSETELDRTIIESIKDPLTHLVRNAVDHGIEAPHARVLRGKPPVGCLRLRAFHESGQVIIEIVDDGAGIDVDRITRRALERGVITREEAARRTDHELMQLIFLPGFSTAERVTNVSGRGVGMDVVRTNIEKIGGTIEMGTRPGQGTTFKVKIPLTLAIIPALIVSVGGESFAIPQVSLLELVHLEREQARRGIETIRGAPIFRLRGELLPLVELGRMLGISDTASFVVGREETRGRPISLPHLRDMHLRRKGRLERFLDGRENIDPDQLATADQCELGRWLTHDSNRGLIGRAEFARLIRAHVDLHDAIRSVVVSKRSGREEEAAAALERVEVLRTEFVSALVAVERLLETVGTVNIVVLQADGRRFGLVVDGINDTEEIVVKPLGKPLKGLSLFAGATIMGDGRVSLILDVSGIAQRAGVVSATGDRPALGEGPVGPQPEQDRSAYLLLRHGDGGRVAIPLSHVARLEEIPLAAIETSADREVVQYRDQIIPLVRLSRALNRGRRAGELERDPMQLVVYTQGGQSVGLVVDEILDIVEDAVHVRSLRAGRGLLGSAVIQQRVTDILDVPGLIHAVDPDLATAGVGVGD